MEKIKRNLRFVCWSNFIATQSFAKFFTKFTKIQNCFINSPDRVEILLLRVRELDYKITSFLAMTDWNGGRNCHH